jgi:hypothetical protein
MVVWFFSSPSLGVHYSMSVDVLSKILSLYGILLPFSRKHSKPEKPEKQF